MAANSTDTRSSSLFSICRQQIPAQQHQSVDATWAMGPAVAVRELVAAFVAHERMDLAARACGRKLGIMATAAWGKKIVAVATTAHGRKRQRRKAISLRLRRRQRMGISFLAKSQGSPALLLPVADSALAQALLPSQAAAGSSRPSQGPMAASTCPVAPA